MIVLQSVKPLIQLAAAAARLAAGAGRVPCHSGTAAIASKTGPATYIHSAVHRHATNAGASERAGFIDAPLIYPAKNAYIATTPLTATPAITPTSETQRITYIRIAVSIA